MGHKKPNSCVGNKKINISQQIWEFFPPIIGHKKTGQLCWKQKRSRQVLSADQLFQSGPKGGTGSPQVGGSPLVATELMDRNSIFTLEVNERLEPQQNWWIVVWVDVFSLFP